VLAVARNADLVLLTLDVFDPNYRPRLVEELEGIGIRLDQSPPNIFMHSLLRGGLNINYTVKCTHINDRMITGIMNEYGIHNANITIRCDATVDQFIDVIVGTRKYIPSLTVVNKTDLVKPEFLKSINYPHVPVSAEKLEGIGNLKAAIWDRLQLIRIYTKPRIGEADAIPMMMRTGATVGDMCDKLHRDLRMLFRHAQIWGPSAKFPGQKAGIDHVLKDGDTICIFKK